MAFAFAAGCADEQVQKDGESYTIFVDSQAPIDKVTWYEGRECVKHCDTPLTPQQIADGEPSGSGTLRFGSLFIDESDAPTKEHTIGSGAPIYIGPTLKLLVLGYRRDQADALALAAAAIVDVEFGADGHFTDRVRLTDELVPDIEFWSAKHCAHVDDDYFVRGDGDRDCDGVLDTEDCTKLRYCDPSLGICECT